MLYAVRKGFVVIVESLLQAGADPNLRGPDGAVALHAAVSAKRSDIVELLMKFGADPEVKGPSGKSAAELAREYYGTPDGQDPGVVALLEGKPLQAVTEAKLKAFLENWPVGKRFREFADGPMLEVMRGRDGEPQRLAVSERVTVGQWNACHADKGCKGLALRGEPDSVAVVSGVQELQYVSWLLKTTGEQGYRLMSNREYRARSGKAAVFWGVEHPWMMNPFELKRLYKLPNLQVWPDKMFGVPMEMIGNFSLEGRDQALHNLRIALKELEKEQGFRVARWLEPDADGKGSESKARSGREN